MRAWTYRKTGKPEVVLKLEDDRPLPALAGHPIIVKVKAAALNPVGYKVMSQMPCASPKYLLAIGSRPPFLLGLTDVTPSVRTCA